MRACIAACACVLAFACCPPAVAHARTEEGAGVEVVGEDAARSQGVAFALTGFERLAKGTAREGAGLPEGYRFPVDAAADVVVIRAPEGAIVCVDEAAAQRVGFDTASKDHAAAMWAMICALDEQRSMGGALLAEAPAPLAVIGERAVELGAYRYNVDARGANDARYATVTLAAAAPGSAGAEAARAAGVDLGDGALWLDYARLVPAEDVAAAGESSPQAELVEFLSSMDYRPFWVSLKTSGIALAVSFVLGLLAAWRVMGVSSRLKGLLDSIFTIPMVLPPTVCGFVLLMLFGRSTAVGQWLIDHGVSLVFTWEAAVISAVVVSFPLVYRTALGAFESLDSRMLDAARTLGWSEARMFCRLMLPMAWPSIAAGTVLAFARAMGEFGCTLFFAGNYAGITQTIPLAIYFEWMGGNTDVALFWVAVVIAFSFAVVWGINGYTARHRRYLPGAPGRGGKGSVARRRKAQHEDVRDGLEAGGGDAMRIDVDALRELFEDGAK